MRRELTGNGEKKILNIGITSSTEKSVSNPEHPEPEP
jgi:hypothetical protein